MIPALQAPLRENLQDKPGTFLRKISETSRPRLLLLITDDWYFRSHRFDLAKEARDAGMEVLVSTLADDDGKWINQAGFKYLPIPFVKGSRNPLRELSAVVKLTQLYRRERPDIVHHVAMKPVLYGSWAARLAGIRAVVNAFGGLGCVFTSGGMQCRVLRIGLRIGLRTALALPHSRVVLQTAHDRERLIREKIIGRDQTMVIRGVGVDTAAFTPQPETDGAPLVLLACRMLWDKGVGEFVRAATLLKEQGSTARFVLVGRTDPANPHAISEGQLLSWQQKDLVEWWGHRDDMPQVLAAAWIVVLPTFYGEGVPKILLEACACARPIITTALPGCTEVVRNGENGLLIPEKDPEALAKAISVLSESSTLRARMGARGREIVVSEFSAQRMARQTLAVYEELLKKSEDAC